MATPAEEIQYLKEKNNELAQKVQYWMMMAGQREDEKLALMKENNELRLKLSRLRNSGGTLANNLEAAIQTASEQALSHLVQASTEITHIAEATKAYMRDRLDLEVISPRWSAPNVAPINEKTDRVHRVPPMMIGGQSIQPVVALSRTIFNTSNLLPQARSVNENRSASVRAVPMHMLQDVYIPLTRIDAGSRQTNNRNSESDTQNQSEENSAVNSDVEDDYTEDRMDEDSHNISDSGDYEQLRLEPVTEEVEPVAEVSQSRSVMDNPLEGPSWLLDSQTSNVTANGGGKRVTLEPDSTTGADEVLNREPVPVLNSPGRDHVQNVEEEMVVEEEDVVALHVFTPTVRRRKRTCLSPVRTLHSPVRPPLSPHTPHTPHSPIFPPPRPLTARRNSMSRRVLKVLVAKMRIAGSDDDDANADASPSKRSAHCSPGAPPSPRRSPAGAEHHARFDAPSPNGATDAKVIVSETKKERDVSPEGQSGGNATGDLWRNVSRRIKHELGERKSRVASHTSSDSEDNSEWITEGRTRRNRKPVTYTEKPLNRKMRR